MERSVEMEKMKACCFGGEYFLLTEEAEVQGRRIIRLPPRRGDIMRKIIASMAESLAESLRAMSKRAQKLNKLYYNQIVLFLCKMRLCSKSGPRAASMVEALNQINHDG